MQSTICDKDYFDMEKGWNLIWCNLTIEILE